MVGSCRKSLCAAKAHFCCISTENAELIRGPRARRAGLALALRKACRPGLGLSLRLSRRSHFVEACRLRAESRVTGHPGSKFWRLRLIQLWKELRMVSKVLGFCRGARLGVISDPSDRFQHLGEWHVRTQRVLAR